MKDKPISIKWFIPHYINVFLRAVGQVNWLFYFEIFQNNNLFLLVYSKWTFKMICILQPAFVNNPIAGLIILIGLFLPDWRIGLGCLIGGSISTITELVRITKRLVYWFFHIYWKAVIKFCHFVTRFYKFIHGKWCEMESQQSMVFWLGQFSRHSFLLYFVLRGQQNSGYLLY